MVGLPEGAALPQIPPDVSAPQMEPPALHGVEVGAGGVGAAGADPHTAAWERLIACTYSDICLCDSISLVCSTLQGLP